jgi:hypothetical protein
MQMCLEKIDWYKQKSTQLKQQYEQEREGVMIMKKQADDEL